MAKIETLECEIKFDSEAFDLFIERFKELEKRIEKLEECDDKFLSD